MNKIKLTVYVHDETDINRVKADLISNVLNYIDSEGIAAAVSINLTKDDENDQ